MCIHLHGENGFLEMFEHIMNFLLFVILFIHFLVHFIIHLQPVYSFEVILLLLFLLAVTVHL